MPQFRITSPDGKEFIVTAPDGASQDQVLEYAKSQWSKKQAAPEKPKAPLEDPGALQSLLIGAGRTFDRLGKGAQQMYYGATGNDAALAELKRQAENDDEAYKPLKDARPFSTGIGEAAPVMLVPGGVGKTLGATALRMGALAAVPAALEYGSVEDRAKRAGAAAAGGAAVPFIGAAARSAKSLAEPLYQKGREQIAGRLLQRVAGSSADDVAARLANAAELVPGSAPTAGQVAQSGGIAALERAAAAANPEAYTKRAMDQASARMTALRGIAGDDAALAAAKDARDSAAQALYGTAFSSDKMRRELVAAQAKEASFLNPAGANIAVDDLATPGLRELMQRPSFKKAADEARALAKDGGIDIGDPTKSLQGLHYIKLALDDMAQPNAASALGKNAQRAIQDMRSKLADELEKIAPMYGNARTTFQQMSEPINQMEIGRALADKLAPALADHGALGRETAATFANALRNGDALAANATGFKGAKLDKVLTPNQMATLSGIAQDLARKANAQDLGRGVGSDTFQKLSMQNIAQQSGMPRLVGGLLDLPGVSRATNWIYRDTDQKLQDLLAQKLLDPKEAAKLMQKGKPGLLSDPKQQALLDELVFRGGGLLGLAGASAVAP